MKSENHSGHFLNKKQKKIKGEIMNKLMESLFGTLEVNKTHLDMQSIWDMVGSILVMFNREVLTHMFMTTGTAGHRKDIMKSLFENIRDQVNANVKKGMM